MAQYPVAQGADVNYRDTNSKTACDYAAAHGKSNVAGYLQSHGGKSGVQ